MVCTISRLRLLILLGLTIMLVGGSYFLTTLPETISRLVGWVGIGFFGLGFVVVPVQFFKTGPQVIINDQGIEDRRLKIGVIPWKDIRSIEYVQVSSEFFLGVELIDPDRYLSQLSTWQRWISRANRSMGLPSLNLGFSALRPGINEVWNYIQLHVQN